MLLGQIGAGVRRHLEAGPEDLKRLARDLPVESLSRLVADLELVPWMDGAELRGRVQATATRLCGVTLEPFEERVDEPFTIQIVPAGSPLAVDAQIEADLPLDAPDPPDVSEDGRIDLAAYALEHLALGLDPFPRKPDAVFEPPADTEERSPFAVLRQLKPRGGEPE